MPLPGSIDRYRILAEIGRGAMGTVYRAHDPRLDREVAVKTISGVVEEGTQGDELTVRFEREARVAARFRHPNVVAVHDAGRDGDRLFLVLELVEGESLGARLARGDFPGRAEALELAAQAADALAAAHAAGIIHRDVKPGNLLLAKDGRVLMTDFGIAKALGETSELTRTGMVVGSPAYLSPEQVQGQPLDGRSDLFSLGVVLFEMVLQRKPFAAETFTSLVYQILTADPLASGDDLRTLPPELAGLLRDALAKDREHRIPDARLFAARAREIARALPERSAMAAPTLVLASSTAVHPPSAPMAPIAPIPPIAPPAIPPPPAVWATAPTAHAPAAVAASGARPARGAWLGFALGALAVGAAVAAVLVFRVVGSRPAPPVTGAAPAVALVDSARPLAQPEPPAAQVQPAGPPIAAETATATPPQPTTASTAPTTPTTPTTAPTTAMPPSFPASIPGVGAAPGAAVAHQPRSTASGATAPAAIPGVAPAGSPGSSVAAEGAEPQAAAPAMPRVLSAVTAPAISETFETKSAAEFHVSPEEATVTIDGVAIGIADDWDGVGGGKEYVFPGPGSYLVRLDADGYQTAWVRVVVRPEARKKLVKVDTELEEVE